MANKHSWFLRPDLRFECKECGALRGLGERPKTKDCQPWMDIFVTEEESSMEQYTRTRDRLVYERTKDGNINR